VLVHGASGDPAEALNSLLRNAGVAAHCRWAADARDVADTLGQLAPEMLVAVAPSPTELAELAASRDHLAPTVPLLVMRDRADSAVAGADMSRLMCLDGVCRFLPRGGPDVIPIPIVRPLQLPIDGDALRQAKLAIRKHPARRHPYYWAGFIQSGEWAGLDGQR